MFKLIFIFYLYFISYVSEAQVRRQELPSNMYHINLDPTFLNRVNSFFQEHQQISESFLQGSPNIHLQNQTSLNLTFIGEGAVQRNTFGYFLYNQNNRILGMYEIFGNASGAGSGISGGGLLNPGDSVLLGNFSAGTRIGFYLIPHGWIQPKNYPFYSIAELNKDKQNHFATYYDSPTEQIVYGVEDLTGGGDRDYNDLIFSVYSDQRNILSEVAQSSGIYQSSPKQILQYQFGMVNMTIGPKAAIMGLDNITLYQLDLNQVENVEFVGNAYFTIERNVGVLIVVQASDLVLGSERIPLTYSLNGSGHQFFTPPGKGITSNQITFTAVAPNITLLQQGTWSSQVTITVSVY